MGGGEHSGEYRASMGDNVGRFYRMGGGGRGKGDGGVSQRRTFLYDKHKAM